MKQHRKYNYKLLIWIMIFSICIGVVSPAQIVYAETETVGTVTTEDSYGANVREGAGTTYSTVGFLEPGTEVVIVGEARADNGVLWYQITMESGTGFVSSTRITGVTEREKAENGEAAEPGIDNAGTGEGVGGETTPEGNVIVQETLEGGEVIALELYSVTRIGTVTASSLYMRNGPGTEYQHLGSLLKGARVIILGEATATTGVIWYKVNYEGLIGYCHSKFFDITEEADPLPEDDQDFEAYLDAQGFPESYKKYLRILHKKYPNWVFQAQHTGLSWDDVVYEEYKFGDMLGSSYGTKAISLLAKSQTPSSWKSLDDGAYNWETSEWVTGWDGPAWVIPSKALVAYYLDPRNFLGENTVFQFLDMSFDANIQTVEGVRAMANSTSHSRWLAGTVTDTDESLLDYSKAIYEAGRDYGINPYALLSIINQEVSEGHGSVIGTFKGYEGYFNFYNIGAYVAEGFDTPVARGLWYAKQDGSLGRPWDSRLKAIRGGAQHFAVNYVKKKQETLYLKRFDVFDGGNGRYAHQFSTNIQAANSEGKKLASIYTEELRQNVLVFKIPVYKNMPSSPCEQPTGDGSPNNKLKSITVNGYSLSPAFHMDTQEYQVKVSGAPSVTISAVTLDKKDEATVSGTGNIPLAVGNNTVEIKVTAGNGDVRIYTLHITRTAEWSVPQYMAGITAIPCTVSTLREQWKTMSDTAIVVKRADGTVKADSDYVGTGDVAVFTNGSASGETTVIIYGDVNGDGKIFATDYVAIKNHIMGKGTALTGAAALAADVNNDSKIFATDYVAIKNHIMGKSQLSQSR